MNINQFQYVLAISKYGSISKAANALFVSQPSISQQLHELETELGVPLFTRHSRGLTLTDAGKVFVKDAGHILDEINALKSKMYAQAEQTKKRIRMGVMWSFFEHKVTELITTFHSEHSDIDIALYPNDGMNLLQNLTDHKVDCIIILCGEDDVNDVQLEKIELAAFHTCVLLNKESDLCKKEIIQIRDLEGRQVLLPGPQSLLTKALLKYCELSLVNPNVLFYSSNIDVTFSYVEKGFAVSFSTDYIAEKRKNSAIVSRPIEPDIEQKIFYVTLKESLKSSTINLLTEHVTSFVNERKQ